MGRGSKNRIRIKRNPDRTGRKTVKTQISAVRQGFIGRMIWLQGKCVCSSTGLQKHFQSGKLIIQDQIFGKHFLVYKISGISKIPHMFFAVAVAGKKNRKIIFSAAAENFPVVGPSITAVAVRRQRGFIDLKNYILFSSFKGQFFIISRKPGIVTVSQNLYMGIFHSVYVSFRVFFTGSIFVILTMDAGNGIVQGSRTLCSRSTVPS